MKLDLAVLKEMLSDGKSYSDIARHFNVSRQYVHSLAKSNELERQWKTYESSKQKKLKAFNLSADFYEICSLRFCRKRQNCKHMGIPFELEFTDIYWPTHCPVLGIELDYWGETGKRAENSPSFDKIDPEKGYVKGNVNIISWRANRIKNDGTSLEHIKIAEYIDKCVNKNIDLST